MQRARSSGSCSRIDRGQSAFRALDAAAGRACGWSRHHSRRDRLLPSWIESFAVHYRVMSELMRLDAPGIDATDLPYHAVLSELDIDGRIRGRDPVNTSLYMWQRTMLINYILTVLVDRVEMAHSVEGRVPFLDHRVANMRPASPFTTRFVKAQKSTYCARPHAT